MSEKKEYIERGAFIDFIDAGHLRYATEKVFSENDLVKTISEQPSVDVEPVVRGEWIEHLHGGTDEYGYLHETTYYTCSNCGRAVTSTTTRCHTCFAHMERSGSGE